MQALVGEAAAWTAGPTTARAKAAMVKKVFMFSQAGMLEENGADNMEPGANWI